MKKTLFGIICCFFMLHATAGQPVNVIFDSDMGPDYDDTGAITLLHALADRGEAQILGTIASTRYEGVAGVFDVFNTYFERPFLPVGVPGKNGLVLRDWQHWSDTLLAKYPHRIRKNDEAWNAVALYRHLLAGARDHSVTIVCVGFLTNLSDLLESGPDASSPSGGPELVRQKVACLVCMAGKFPQGKEFNIMTDVRSSRNVFTNWPGRLLFNGFEIGEKILTGLPLVQNSSISHDPVQDVFRICLPMAKEDSAGRKSWDESTVLAAVRGWQQYYRLHRGKIILGDDGSNRWDDAGKGQYYLVLKTEKGIVGKIKREIDQLMQQQPGSQ